MSSPTTLSKVKAYLDGHQPPGGKANLLLRQRQSALEQAWRDLLKYSNMKETIVIQNLKCSGCAASIGKALKAFPEVETVTVDLEQAAVTIETKAAAQREQYERALTEAGYPPEGEKNPLGRKAKSFVSCAIGRMG